MAIGSCPRWRGLVDQVDREGSGQRRALASPSALWFALQWVGNAGATRAHWAALRSPWTAFVTFWTRESCVAVGCQYSSARMMLRTRVVTAGSPAQQQDPPDWL